MENRTISESWKPTFENVSREFLTNTMYKILYSDELPNFRFEFREDEAINFIEKVLQDYTNKYDFFYEESQKILESINNKSNDNETQPIMIVSDYKEFFELLRKYYEKTIELYFERTGMSGFPRYEKENCFEQIWLRATPDDFNNPEQFLRKQVDMISDNTFKKYDEETYLGTLSKLDNHPICIQNRIARTWDETTREFRITIYDKRYYDNKELIYRPHYTLPVVRYGIYEKGEKKICYIGSIQNIRFEEDKDSDLVENINIARTELNEGELKKQNYKDKVEPTKTLALSIFVDFLNKEGITEIEAPSMYALDHEYHNKRGINLKKKFDEEWTEEEKEKSPETYQRAKEYLSMNYKKEDIISEIKTERFIHNLERLLYHYPNGKIKSYPGELDSFLHIEIPSIKSRNGIKGDILKDMYDLVEEKYEEKER